MWTDLQVLSRIKLIDGILLDVNNIYLVNEVLDGRIQWSQLILPRKVLLFPVEINGYIRSELEIKLETLFNNNHTVAAFHVKRALAFFLLREKMNRIVTSGNCVSYAAFSLRAL